MIQDSSMPSPIDTRIAIVSNWALTFAIVVIFLWFGCLKFTPYEQSGVAGFIMNSPLIGWLHSAFGIAGGAQFLGVFEILTALLIAGRVFDSRLSLIGGALGALTFLITMTLMFTTPGVIQPGYESFLALSAVPGQFLLKDLGLLAACLWICGMSWTEVQMSRSMPAL